MSRRRKHTVRLIYKSGTEMLADCDEFTVTREGGRITRVKYENIKPYPLAIGVDELAAVWLVR